MTPDWWVLFNVLSFFFFKKTKKTKQHIRKFSWKIEVMIVHIKLEYLRVFNSWMGLTDMLCVATQP